MLCQFRINNYYISLIKLYASNTLEQDTWKYLFIWRSKLSMSDWNAKCKMDHNSDWSNFFKHTAVLKGATPIFFTVCVCTLSLCWGAGRCSVWWFDVDEKPGLEVWSLHALTADTVQNPNPVWNAPSELKTCNPHCELSLAAEST